MTDEDESPDDRMLEQLRGTARDLTPPPALETRATARLIDAGLVCRPSTALPPSSRPRTWTALGVAAALVLAFLGGWMAGGRTGAPVEPGNRYVLLLYAGSQRSPGPDDHVQAYRDWARDLRGKGRFVSGERLAPRRISPESATEDEALEGYFVIEANSDREALAIAESHPHARSGGRVVVRRIEPT